MNLKDIGNKLIELGLPVLGAAVGGPQGLLIGKMLADKLGTTPSNLQETLQDDPQALAEARALDAEMKRMGLDYARLDGDDRKDARGREVLTKDNTTRVLAYIVIGGFMAVIVATLAGWAKVNSVLAGTLIGYLSAKAEQVIAYYFGSSSGSAEKTRLMMEGKR